MSWCTRREGPRSQCLCPQDGLSGTELLQVLSAAPAAAPTVGRRLHHCCWGAPKLPKLLAAALALLALLGASLREAQATSWGREGVVHAPAMLGCCRFALRLVSAL